MKMRRLLSCIMALLLAASLPLTAFADEYDLVTGSVTVNASESGQTVTQENNPDRQNYADSSPKISSSGTTTNTVTITAGENATANVTLGGVNIDTSTSTSDTGETKAAITIEGAGDVDIELEGTITVQSGDNHAGVEKNNSDSTGNLTIADDNGTSGTLTATGGTGGAGIGGECEQGGSNITISGGTVTATGGEQAAGIGGGSHGDGTDITITGGNVTAIGSAPKNDDGTEAVTESGSGIGGGAYGEGKNIKIENDAIVTATGKGIAANIGNGYPKDSTQQQPDNGNVDDLYTTGSVNGHSGTKEPPKKNDNGQSSGGGYTVNVPCGIRVSGSSGNMESRIYASDYVEKDRFLKVRILGQNGQNLPFESSVNGDKLTIAVAANNATLTGDRNDLKTLTDQGIRKTVLETNRVSVSVSNDRLTKITNANESFLLSTDGTSFSLTTTDQNNEEKVKAKLEYAKDFVFSVESAYINDSLGNTLYFTMDAENVILTLSGNSLQTLTDRGIDSTAITGRDLTIGFNNSDVLKQIDANFDSKLGSASVILNTNGVQNDDGVYRGSLTVSATDVGSDKKVNTVTEDTSDCSWMTKYFTNFRVEGS